MVQGVKQAWDVLGVVRLFSGSALQFLEEPPPAPRNSAGLNLQTGSGSQVWNEK